VSVEYALLDMMIMLCSDESEEAQVEAVFQWANDAAAMQVSVQRRGDQFSGQPLPSHRVSLAPALGVGPRGERGGRRCGP
jgi:hypothetical protein